MGRHQHDHGARVRPDGSIPRVLCGPRSPGAGTYTPWACSQRPREQRFGESGLSRDEFDEAERQQRLRDLSVAVEIQRDGAADPPDVADALSLRHWGGPPVRLAVLLLGSHLAQTPEDASRLCEGRKGGVTPGLAAPARPAALPWFVSVTRPL